MEVIQTVKLDRNEINAALEDYLAKQGYQANKISFEFSENHFVTASLSLVPRLLLQSPV